MFSGTARDIAGKPLSGPVDLNFAIYKSQADAEPLWQESQTLNLDEFGHYTVLMGAMQPQGLPVELFTSGEARWLGVSAGKLAEQPRVLLVSVPYALKSQDAEMLGGKPASAYALVQPVESATFTAGSATAAHGAAVRPEAAKSPKLTSGLTPYYTATGSAGYIPRYSNAGLDLGNSVIFQYGSRIGVGTATPTYGFDLNSNVFAIGPTTAKPGAGGTMRFRDDSATVRWSFGVPGTAGATDFFLYNNVNGHAPFYIQAGAFSYSLYMNANGNVGIGTTTPAQKLDVMGSVRINGTGNAIIFPDNTVMTSAGAGTNGGTITQVTAGTGLSGGGTAGPVTLSLAASSCTPGSALTGLPLTCQPFANLGANTFSAAQTISSGDVSLTNGNLTLPDTSGANAGVLKLGGNPFLHVCCAGLNNTFVGINAGTSTGNFNTSGNGGNTGVGFEALKHITTGYFNTASGYEALGSNQTGASNTAIGWAALFPNTSGFENTAVGESALADNTTGHDNTALGKNSLFANCTGAGAGCTGNYNTAVGAYAGTTNNSGNANTTGASNTFIGAWSGPGTSTQLTNASAIGANAAVSADNSLVLGSISGVNGATSSVKVGIGTQTPTTTLQVAGGDVSTTTAGKGLIVKSPDGTKCARIGIDDTGAIAVTSVSCP